MNKDWNWHLALNNVFSKTKAKNLTTFHISL